MIRWMMACLCALASLSANADFNTQIFNYSELQSQVMDDARVMGLDWKVGDNANYNVNMGFVSGTMEMKVRELITEGYWVEQNLDLGFMGKNKIEILFDKNTGQILQLLVNGQKQEIPDAGGQEVEEMKEANITVPAGTFDCIYLKIRDTKENKTSEAWLNPQVIPIAGMVKQVAPGPFGSVTMELTSYSKQ